MKDYVTDTHSLFWYVSRSSNLGRKAISVFENAENREAMIHIPAIVFAELFYLNVKLRNQIDFAAKFHELEEAPQFVLTPFEAEDVLDFTRDSGVTEMHDRIIVGLARRLNVPLLTVDKNIIASGAVETLW
jgi:PIN domain nuclease of toxin-antitoxin system